MSKLALLASSLIEELMRRFHPRRTVEMAAAIKNTFEPIIMTHLYPRSQIEIFVTVLSQDGGEYRSIGVHTIES